MGRHTFNLLAVTVEINARKPHDARVDLICGEDTFHFLMSQATLETLQGHISDALAKVTLRATLYARASHD